MIEDKNSEVKTTRPKWIWVRLLWFLNLPKSDVRLTGRSNAEVLATLSTSTAIRSPLFTLQVDTTNTSGLPAPASGVAQIPWLTHSSGLQRCLWIGSPHAATIFRAVPGFVLQEYWQLFLTSLCIFWTCSPPCVASGVLGIHQNKGVNVSTSWMWGNSVISKASSFCFVTEEAAPVNLHGKLQHRAGWQRRTVFVITTAIWRECAG